MFPYTHAESVADMFIHFSTECFHASNLEIVNPSSDELIEFLHFVAVANAPATTSKSFHSLLKFRN